MTSGLPDYSLGVRPGYGGAFIKQGTKIVTPSTETQLDKITGRGMLYGGYVTIDHNSTQKDSAVRIVLDLSQNIASSFEEMNKYRLEKDLTLPIILNKFDDTEFIYSVSFTFGMTFETELIVKYNEFEGSTPVVRYQVIYALI